MAHIANRSRFRVTVKNRPDLTQHFSFSKVAAVEAYMKELRAQGYRPRAEQLDESWLVRIRERGHKQLEATFNSEAAATQFIEKTSEERKRGLFIDYTDALKVTFADVLVRYLLEEAGKKKSGAVLAYVLEGWLEDSGPRGVELLTQYRDKLRAQGRKVREPQFRMRQPGTELGWIHKRLAEVTTVDIEGFIDERLEVVAKGTVDRDIDRLKAIFKVAMQVWDLNLAKNPMDAVRRPDFFNERDRRISADEERRLLEALAQLDLERAVQPVLCELADQELSVNRPGNFNIRPESHPDGHLVQEGPYRWVRHPMYGAVLLLAAGATAWLANAIGVVLWVGLLAVLTAKATLEEQWLLKHYPPYANYRLRTWRLIPWIY